MGWVWATSLVSALLVSNAPSRVAWVSVDTADVLVAPEDTAFSTGRVSQRQKITVVRDGPEGWVTIAPPPGSFSFVEEADLEDLGDGTARILVRYASVRPGRENARMPGPPTVTLRQGTIVKLLDRRPLVVRNRGAVRNWVAISPPKNEVRFLRDETVTDVEEPEESSEPETRLKRLASNSKPVADPERESQPPARELGPIDPSFFSAKAPQADPKVSGDIASALAGIAMRHQSELRKPIEEWDLAPIESAYEQLAKKAIADEDRRAIGRRLAIVKHQRGAAEGAKQLAGLVNKSRSRDSQIAAQKRSSDLKSSEIAGDYDAAGLLQTSSRMVEGRRVYTLLGDDGRVVAFVSVPPGLSVREYLSHRVGVRGEGRFDETLRARLILAKEIEILKGTDANATPSIPVDRRKKP